MKHDNHLLTLVGLSSLMVFAWNIGKPDTPFSLGIKIFGCGCALAAAIGYREEHQHQQHTTEQDRLRAAVGETEAGFAWTIEHLKESHQAEIHRYEAAIAQLQTRIQQLQNRNFAEFEAQREQLTLQINQWEQEKLRFQEACALEQAALAEEKQRLQAHKENFDAELKHQLEAEVQRLEAVEAQLEQRYQTRVAQLEQDWQEKEDFYTSIAGRAMQEAQNLKAPDLPQGISHEELLAREAIRCLHQHNIVVKKPFVKPLPQGCFELNFEVLPVLSDGETSTVIRSAGEALKKIKTDVLPQLQMAVPGCCKTPNVEPIEGGLRLVFDVSGTNWSGLERERKERAEQIIDPPERHLAQFVLENPQISLMGDSGNGKTTLINNLIDLMEAELGEDAELIIVNPKPDEHTDLSRLKYDDFDTCIFGLLEAAAEILYRVRLNTLALRKRKEYPDHPLPHLDPIIYFFDEFSELSGVWNRCKPDVMEETLEQFRHSLPVEKLHTFDTIYKRVSPGSFAADLLKFCWRVGRSEKVKLLIAGQNLKAGTIGTTIQDLHQTALIYLGEAIQEGLDNRVSSWQRDPLKEEYAHRQQLVFAGKASKFYGLFVPKGNRSYFATLPDQNAYSTAVAPSAPISTVPPVEAAPDLLTAPDPVQELERLWHLPSEARTEDDSTRTNPVQGHYDPLEPSISAQLAHDVLSALDALKTQGKVIAQIWGVSRSGTNPKYRAAKWKFRHILQQNGREILGKAWGQDPDDSKTFHELLED